ncbi:subtilisin-like protein [Lentinula aciculospora]|uniref:Subtilisin-like protein n=1 Tax=Lentinula aciculospora TaxID=153920 RepID=A0A9W9AS32_9AGAR|nr:subtilisin-like protein [Lentinula aciculospora]
MLRFLRYIIFLENDGIKTLLQCHALLSIRCHLNKLMIMVPQSFIRNLVLSTSILSSTVWASTYVVHEKRDTIPSGFTHLSSAPDDQVINMRINLAMGNQAGLEAALEKASSPTSPNFREWLTKEQVETFAAPTAETVEAVTEWLSSFNITSAPATPAGDWIKFNIPVQTANRLLNTQFSIFNHTESGQTSIRTLEYSIPSNIQAHVKVVHPTTSFNGPLRGRSPITAVSAAKFAYSIEERATVDCNSTITPACLQTLYGIPTKLVSPSTKSKIGVAGYTPQNANEQDLATFLEEFRPDLPSNLTFITELYDGAINYQSGAQAGLEANLDIQYTVGLVNGIPAVFEDIGYTTNDGPDDGYLDSLNDLISQTSPPLVFSTSYGFDEESALSLSLTVAYCNAIMQLASRGVTVTFASGDGGVASSPGLQCEGSSFPPTFPTCPYATLVGATQNVPEIGASLTAGGFSNYFPQQSWQADAVNAYIDKIGDTYAGLYNASGRAYPDVSAQGGTVEIIINGHVDYVGGTSCSSPIFSSVVALLNDELMSAGKSPMGFLNPWIYANPQAFNDITSGNNPGCGTEGFSALEGWDPVTGMGSPNYAAMRTAAGL